MFLLKLAKKLVWLRGLCGLCGAVALFSPQTALAVQNYTIQQVGLTGGIYTINTASGFEQSGFIRNINSSGQAAGVSFIYNGGEDSWFFNGSTSQRIGLISGIYTNNGGGGTTRYDRVISMSDNAKAMGTSNRYDASGNSLGLDTWYFNGMTTQQIGLAGGIYAGTTASGTTQNSYQVMNNSGQVMGNSSRYSSDGINTSRGQDSWLFDGSSTKQIGFTGLNYGYSSALGTFEYSGVLQQNNGGLVTGYSDRFFDLGTVGTLGADSWLYNGSSTKQIGLTGGDYGYAAVGGTQESSRSLGLNSIGEAIGVSNRYNSLGNSLGQDSWIFNGATSQQIGLIGGVYGSTVRNNTPLQINDVGDVTGYSLFSVSSSSQDSWLFDGTTTRQIGLTGGIYAVFGEQYSIAQQLNNSGQVIGYSKRYNGQNGVLLGQDPWRYDGTSTQQMGLTGGVYSYSFFGNGTFQMSVAQQINNAGQVIGYSNRYDASGNSLGQDAWYFNGATQPIGLSGGVHSYAGAGGIFQSSTAQQINKSGQVVGTSNRYDSSGNSLGQDGWFFDPATDVTTSLQFSVDSANNFSSTSPEILTDTGVVLGQYELYVGSTDEGLRAFYWSLSNGFYDLGSLVSGGLTAAGWQDLALVDVSSVPGALGTAGDGSPQYIAGVGSINGQYGNGTEYLLSASVPEPRMPSLVLIAGLGLLAKRRREPMAVA
ncbi:MAG: DUF3466 family protein [Planctomycetota bacterium]|nr:DUF3466 family protein [Planctomycetota bacterium]